MSKRFISKNKNLFPCSKCDHSYASVGALNKHVKIKHKTNVVQSKFIELDLVIKKPPKWLEQGDFSGWYTEEIPVKKLTEKESKKTDKESESSLTDPNE